MLHTRLPACELNRSEVPLKSQYIPEAAAKSMSETGAFLLYKDCLRVRTDPRRSYGRPRSTARP